MDENNEAMGEEHAPQPAEITQATLTSIVQRALNNEAVELLNWDSEQLHAGTGGGTIYRYSGRGRDQEQTISWSLILKVIRPEDGCANLAAWNYYKREAEAYRSGWFDDLPGGITAPRHFGVFEHPDGTCWIWLEDITDAIGQQWPLAHYGVVARHLGQFNGAYLMGRPQPDWPWLSSNWCQKWVEQSAPAMAPLRSSLGHPLVRRFLPGDASERLFRLWEERNLFLDTLDRLPQTLCHLDVFRRNLFARRREEGDYQTVAIDWAFVGRGAIGEELVPLIQASAYYFEIELDKVGMLEEVVFERYLEGLYDVGWQGDPRQVRLGYTAGSVRYRFADLGLILTVILDESRHGMIPQTFGCSIEELSDYWGEVGDFYAGLIDEARGLMDVLD